MKRTSIIVAALISVAMLFSLTSCGGKGNKKVSAKIGVIRGDSSSEEALAWENYLKDLAAEMGFSIDFSTAMESADDEMAAVQNYASLGYNGIIAMSSYNSLNLMNICEKYGMYNVVSASHPDFEDSDRTVAKDASIVVTDYKNYPHFVGISGPSNYGEVLAGYQMGKAGINAGYKTYSLFTGAAAYGQAMHSLRIAGLFIAMHDEDPSVTYAGIPCVMDSWKELTLAICADLGVDMNKFTSNTFKIAAQTGGYSFLMGDASAAAAVANLSVAPGVECVFCAGSSDAISSFAPEGVTGVVYIGDDAVSAAFQDLFKQGKVVFDIAKYQSYVGPAVSMLVKAIYDNQSPRINGKPVSIEQQSLQITSAADYDTLNAVECKEGGYFFSSEFLSAFLKGQISVEEFKNICEMDATLGNGGLYAATKKISDDFKAKGNTIFQFTAAE